MLAYIIVISKKRIEGEKYNLHGVTWRGYRLLRNIKANVGQSLIHR
jgi:hypothetical protein